MLVLILKPIFYLRKIQNTVKFDAKTTDKNSLLGSFFTHAFLKNLSKPVSFQVIVRETKDFSRVWGKNGLFG